jgi:hypothetical protein
MKGLFTLIILLATGLATAAVLRDSTTPRLLPDEPGRPVIDLHVHVAGLGHGDSGCFINDDMRDNYRFPFYLWAFGITEDALKQHGDQLIFDQLDHDISTASNVDMAVILAMDGWVSADGKLHPDKTALYCPGEFVARQTARFDTLLYGASINPNRDDAIARLHQAKRDGAVLVKWIPSIMNIDPADPRHIPFYQTLVELGLPLLSHTGMEKSFPGAVDALADPLRLKLPLEQGVTVIAAHIATTGDSDGQDNFERILPMFAQYPNLYTDISSLTQLNKTGYLARALKIPGLPERMLFGTDWPLNFFPLASPWYHLRHLSIADAWRVGGISNQWDRDVALKKAMSVPDAVFTRTGKLLGMETPIRSD